MKKYLPYILLALAVVVAKKTLFSDDNSNNGEATPRNIQVEQLKEKISANDDFLLIDCREPQETINGVIKDPELIPVYKLEKIWAEKYKDVPKDKDIVIYCASGFRSEQGAETLAKMGYTDVKSLSGGISSWARSGGDIKPGKK